LSLVVMTAALARELGMNVTYQSARVDEAYSRNGGLTLRSGHVNIVLGERPTRTPGRTSAVALGGDGDRLQIDFLPAPELQGLHTQPITEQRVLAMFMNNRAAEALQQGQTAQAYAWARVALQRDAGFTSALNTLAVVYQRAGHLPQAQAVLQQVLAQDDHHLAALWNLVQVLQAQGLHGQAQHWQARLAHLEPVPPFAQLQQGQAAMARGEPAKARDLLLAEQRLTGDSHELYFWLARAHHALGDQAAAQRAMAHAQALAPAGEQQSRYAAKLAWLRAQAVH
jgi:predicted Zn-dependent protease